MADNTDDLIISISTDQATLRRSIKRIEQDLGALAGTVKKQFDGVGRAVDNSITSTMQSRINAMVGIGTGAAKEWTGALADQGKELERLRARYSPLFNTINSYKSAVADIRRAHALGAISSNEMAAAIQKERQAALAATAAIKGRNAALTDNPVVRSGAGSFNTSNLAAQGFDIAATAGSMPWYTVALQQGPQVAQVFNDIRASGQSIGPAVAGAFMQLVNPISLVTIGVIGATAAAVTYFSGILSDSDSASEKLKEQAQLIQAVADRWGDAVPALRDYANELQRTQDAADLKAGIAVINEKSLEDTKKQLEDARVSIASLVQDLRAAGDEEENIKRLQTAFNQFATAAGDGSLKTEDVKSVQDALAASIKGVGIPALTDWKKTFDDLSTSALSASENVGKVNGQANRMLPVSTWRSYNPQTGKLETNAQPWDENIQNPGFTTPEVGPVPQGRPLRELEALPSEKKTKSKEETAAQRAANAYRDLKKSADDRLAQMQQEIDLLGKYGIEADAARFSLDLFQQAEDKGRSLSAQQRQELEQKVELYRQYSAQLARAKLQQDLLDQRRFNSMSAQDQQVVTTLRQYGLPEDLNSREAGQIRQSLRTEDAREELRSFFGDFKSALMNNGGDIGKAFGESIQNALMNQANKLWDKLFDQLIDSVLGSPAGGNAAASGGGGLGALGAAVLGGAPSAVTSMGGAVDKASALLGANERTNTGSINAYLKQGGVDINAAQTAWCAAFVNSSLEQIGVKGSGSLTANSFQKWGSAVDPSRVMRGDVLLQTRGLGAGQAGGHVGLATGSSRMSGGQLQLEMLSGNSSNAVTNTWVNATELQVKRATEAASALSKVADSSKVATQGLGSLGQLSSSMFPAAPAAPGGVGGLSWLSSLFGPSLSAAQIAKYTPMVGLFSNGGDVNGPGSATSDSIPAMLSDGEFVVRASATKKHRALLHAINSGRLGHFADGGLVTRASVPSTPTLRNGKAAANDNGQPGVLVVRIDGANGDDHVRMLVQQGVSDGLGQYNKAQERGGIGTVQNQFSKRKG